MKSPVFCHFQVYCKISVLENFVKFTEEHVCRAPFLNKITCCNKVTTLLKRALSQAFPCKLCEISKSNLFIDQPLATTSILTFKIFLLGGFVKPSDTNDLIKFIIFFDAILWSSKGFMVYLKESEKLHKYAIRETICNFLPNFRHCG